MRTNEVDWRFPVLGFTGDADVWGFTDVEWLTTCGPRTIKNNMQTGMVLIEADGRQWIVRSVRRTGSAGSLLQRMVFFGPQLSRVDHELEAQPPASLPETLERVCAAMAAHPDFWCEDDERETVLPARQAEVRAVTSFAGVWDVLGLDCFIAH